ncbi:acyl carrier protein, partial [Sarcoptes scabiei]
MNLLNRPGTKSLMKFRSSIACATTMKSSVENFSMMLFLFGLLILILRTSPVSSSGFFELQFVEGVRNSTTIHVCLKEFWNSQINFNRCTFGQKTVIFHEHPSPKQSSIKIPFSFRWIVNEFAVPGLDWKFRTFHANDGRIITIKFHIACDLYYHSDDCATFCRARNDTFGHYFCQKNGKKQCLPGWKGENCDKPKCSPGCNEAHGFCENPDECICRSGWKGPNCDECVPYPGCLHGYCVSPFQCICHRNWGGILCDQDLNYCGTHEPCLNEGRCENIAPDNYRCVCKKGFSGLNCQIIEDACATSPCLHAGTCITLKNGTDFRCICKNGFSGKRCENDLNECVSQPCLNGATCHDLENNFRCTCPSGWTGDRCEQDVDECSALVTPCIKASACININGSYICVCEK